MSNSSGQVEVFTTTCTTVTRTTSYGVSGSSVTLNTYSFSGSHTVYHIMKLNSDASFTYSYNDKTFTLYGITLSQNTVIAGNTTTIGKIGTSYDNPLTVSMKATSNSVNLIVEYPSYPSSDFDIRNYSITWNMQGITVYAYAI